MRAILLAVCSVGVFAPDLALAQPGPELGPPTWSMPEMSGTNQVGLDLAVAVTSVRETVVTTVPTPVGETVTIDFRQRRTAIVVAMVSAEMRASTGWIVGGEVPYVTSGHPRTASGPGNLSVWARYRKMRTSAPTHGVGAGFALRVPTAKQNPNDLDDSDPDLAADLWVSDYARFRHDVSSVRAHVDVRAGVRTFVQLQASLDLGVEGDDLIVLPRFSLGVGGYVWGRLAVVAEGVATPIPGAGHDLGDNGSFLGRAAAGLRYMGRRFYTGARVEGLAGNTSGYGVGTDFSYLF